MLKKIFALCLVLILACSCLTACGEKKVTVESVQKAGKLVIGTSPDFPPFESLDASGNVVGIEVEIMEIICEQLGVTAEFNLNLLRRINRELGGEFDINQFLHYPIYNPQEGVMRSFLVSKEEQDVYIRNLGQSFHFDAWEAIHTENSHKYTLQQAEELGGGCGFRIEAIFQDQACRFADVLYTVV